jgi:hypothetical protein
LAGLTSVSGARTVHKTAAGAGSDGSGGRTLNYLTVTTENAEPPALDATVTDPGAGDVVAVSAYVFVFALYFIGQFLPSSAKTVSLAVGAAELLACTLNWLFLFV